MKTRVLFVIIFCTLLNSLAAAGGAGTASALPDAVLQGSVLGVSLALRLPALAVDAFLWGCAPLLPEYRAPSAGRGQRPAPADAASIAPERGAAGTRLQAARAAAPALPGDAAFSPAATAALLEGRRHPPWDCGGGGFILSLLACLILLARSDLPREMTGRFFSAARPRSGRALLFTRVRAYGSRGEARAP